MRDCRLDECNEAWPRFLTDTSLMPFIGGMKQRRERDVVRTGEIERDLWAREQIRKETRKGKSLKALPNEGTRTVRENGSASHRERLTMSLRSQRVAYQAAHSFSERPDRNRTPIPESLQWFRLS